MFLGNKKCRIYAACGVSQTPINKNKYEEMVKTYYPYIDNIRAIFWDLNNLKMINDTYGHDYGDKAIERLSSVLYSFVDERR